MRLVNMVILLSLINLPSLRTSNSSATLGFIFNFSFFNLRVIVQPLCFTAVYFREVDQVKLTELDKVLLYIGKACN